MNKSPTYNNLIKLAAHYIDNAEVLLVTSGAGIGVDSGLQDFRGVQGLFK